MIHPMHSVRTIEIDENTYNVNLETLIKDAGITRGQVEVIVMSGVLVGSEDAADPAIATGDLAGYTVRFINYGDIQGKGGDGGAGAAGGHHNGSPGEDGGIGFNATSRLMLVNNGSIECGDGGGGGGGSESWTSSGGGGGGGGRGNTGGTGGIKRETTATPGTDGTLTTNGLGGAASTDDSGDGGDGGNWPTAAINGGNESDDFSVEGYGGIAGSSGYAVSGIENIAYMCGGAREEISVTLRAGIPIIEYSGSPTIEAGMGFFIPELGWTMVVSKYAREARGPHTESSKTWTVYDTSIYTVGDDVTCEGTWGRYWYPAFEWGLGTVDSIGTGTVTVSNAMYSSGREVFYGKDKALLVNTGSHFTVASAPVVSGNYTGYLYPAGSLRGIVT